MEDKFILLNELASAGGVVFVGSCSMYLQGVLDDFEDIDVLVTSLNRLKSAFEVIELEEKVFRFDNRKRAFISKYGIGVDIFIVESFSNTDTVTVDDKECCTIASQIDFLEKIKSYRVIPNFLKQKFNAELNYLNTI